MSRPTMPASRRASAWRLVAEDSAREPSRRCEGDFDEENEGFGLGVVVLLEVGRDGLDLLSVGNLTALQKLGELLLVHLDG
jgi:hypothetical protein